MTKLLIGTNLMIFTCVAIKWLSSHYIRQCPYHNEKAINKQLFNMCLTIEPFAECLYVCMSCWLGQSQDVYSALSFPQLA